MPKKIPSPVLVFAFKSSKRPNNPHLLHLRVKHVFCRLFKTQLAVFLVLYIFVDFYVSAMALLLFSVSQKASAPNAGNFVEFKS